MELIEIAIISVNFNSAISLVVDTYLKIKFQKRNDHPGLHQGGK